MDGEEAERFVWERGNSLENAVYTALASAASKCGLLHRAAAPPIIFEKPFHGLPHSLVVKHHGGPGRARDDRIKQRDHPVLAVEYGEFHRKRIGDAHFHS